MGWSIGYDEAWERDIGYGVPAVCDHPECKVEIDRGLGYVCGGEPFGGDRGCGLFFCDSHMMARGVCQQCAKNRETFAAKPDIPEWVQHKLTHESWAQWRSENHEWVASPK